MMRLSIWIVDDDPVFREMLTSYLSIFGYKSRSFISGEECLQSLKAKERPDIVLLDHNLGEGMNGVEVLRKIKSARRKTRVIYISAEDRASLVSDTYQHGSEEYITKDSASLLRLKLRLDRIVKLKNIHRKRVVKMSVFCFVAIVLFFLLLIF
ncbi:MAG: hypothetical protein DI538_10590 [Azospira oryzae]|jgi:CheY-like chemotaxis protein|nr:MAG: hypothetical protein DI538_10590 [Azospira oryzae]